VDKYSPRTPTRRGASLTTPKRKRREQETLSDRQIVDAALDLIRRDGADGFSMRQLAKQLGVTPMAIYYYFANKDALFERVADAVLARVPRPIPSGRGWREEMKECAVQGFRLLSEYPGLSGQIIKRPPTQQTTELARYGISILEAAGFDGRSAARATTICQAFMFGMIGLQAQLERARRRKRKSASEEPYLDQVDVQGLAEFGLDALLHGFHEQLARSQRPRSATPARRRRTGT
jgi:TetR/AcrR family transcriptional regulator, tetracycline repressor protein